MTQATLYGYNNCDFDFFLALSKHQRLGLRHALLLMQFLGKVCPSKCSRTKCSCSPAAHHPNPNPNRTITLPLPLTQVCLNDALHGRVATIPFLVLVERFHDSEVLHLPLPLTPSPTQPTLTYP